MKQTRFSYHRNFPGIGFDQVVQTVSEALGKEGFGILTRIDVQETFRHKLNKDFKKYLILGACNPQLAHRALTEDDSIGLLLPCNVVVAETPDGTEVGVLRPEALFEFVEAEALRPLASDAAERIQRAFEKIVTDLEANPSPVG